MATELHRRQYLSVAFTDAIPRNDDLFIIAPLRHSAGIIFNTREVLDTLLLRVELLHHNVGIIFNTREIWACSLGEENIHPP